MLEKQRLERGSPPYSSLSTCRSPRMYGFIGSISISVWSNAQVELNTWKHYSPIPLGVVGPGWRTNIPDPDPEDFIGLKRQINKLGSWKHGLLNILVSNLVNLLRSSHQHRLENPAAFTVDWYLTTQSPRFGYRLQVGIGFSKSSSRDLCPISSFGIYTTKRQALHCP